jgi:LysM repeat protein
MLVVRLLPLSFSIILLAALPGRGQVPDPGMAIQQDPGMAQDTEAAREKLAKAADELDMIQANAEASKATIDGMKADIAHLQADNADLKQQIAALQAALEKSEADRAKERAAIVDEVATLVASKSADGAHAWARHHESDETSSTESVSPSTEVHTALRNEVADAGTASGPGADATAKPPPAPKPKEQKGYYHVVENGETLSMIVEAYRDEGVKVTSSQIRKANGLTSKSVLKAGQKLFIPKPVD